jgi:hypothetical protein
LNFSVTYHIFPDLEPFSSPSTFSSISTVITMKGFTFATVAVFAATSIAATVKLEQTSCLNINITTPNSFDVEVNKLTVVDLPTVCGLKIVSADGADVKGIKCKAYRDKEGKEPGSAEFTQDVPAQIGTNPIQEGSILCVSGDDAIPTSGPAPTSFATASTSVPNAAPTGATPSGGNNSSAPHTPGSPNSPTPTPSGGADQPGEGAASTIGMSFGALAGAAIAMLFL